MSRSPAELLQPYLLEVPPRPEFVTTARLFAGTITRQHGFHDAVDDVKLAVSEAVSALITISEHSTPISLEVKRKGDGLSFVLTCNHAGVIIESVTDPEGTVRGLDLVRAIISSLDVTYEQGVTITFEVSH